ncbi:GTPase ObgE [bacterium]|nr:GTPase ObgE [bacterium]
MKFVDQAIVEVSAGNGGAGAVSFRREKYIPLGGPDGGDGGKGGDIVFRGDENITTLYDIRYRHKIKAENGQNGMGANMYGRSGSDEIIKVPVGTLIYDNATSELLADITAHNQSEIICRGGIGGRGNAKFKTSVNKAPRYAQDGIPGESRVVRLELKLIADVGIIGFPSVGKSTLISIISNARPKIAEYPFTTLIPNLGVVDAGDFFTYVVADIPGLIEGAHTGAGLGHRFLRHVERSRFLIHLVEINPARKSPVDDIEKIDRELELFDENLAKREQIFVLNKIDSYTEEQDKLRRELREYVGERPYFEISGITRNGIKELVDFVSAKVAEYRKKEQREQNRQ